MTVSGYHGCARLANGPARCWGDNNEAQLGNGNTNDRGIPTVVQV